MFHAFALLKCWKNGTKAFLRVNRYSVVFTGIGKNKIIVDIEQLYEVIKMITQESGEVIIENTFVLRAVKY